MERVRLERARGCGAVDHVAVVAARAEDGLGNAAVPHASRLVDEGCERELDARSVELEIIEQQQAKRSRASSRSRSCRRARPRTTTPREGSGVPRCSPSSPVPGHRNGSDVLRGRSVSALEQLVARLVGDPEADAQEDDGQDLRGPAPAADPRVVLGPQPVTIPFGQHARGSSKFRARHGACVACAWQRSAQGSCSSAVRESSTPQTSHRPYRSSPASSNRRRRST